MTDNRYPPGHPLAAHPGLPPHPLDGVPGAFPHGHQAPQHRMLPRRPRYAPPDPRFVPLNSQQGHDLPTSPVDQIADVHLDGFSELPVQQPGAGTPPYQDGRPMVATRRIISPYQTRANQVTLTNGNLMAQAGTFVPPLNPFQQVSVPKAILAELDLEEGDSTSATMLFEVVQGPALVSNGAALQNTLVYFEIQYGYGAQTFVRNVTTQQGRIVATGSKFRVSAFLVYIGAVPPGGVPAIPAETAIVKASIIPEVDGQIRTTTMWGGFQTSGGTALIWPEPATLWRIEGYNAGPNLVYVWALDSVTNPPPNGITLGQAPWFGATMGAVPSNGTFSMSMGTSGKDYFTGIELVASSTPQTFTRDATAILAGQFEILIV